MPRNDAFIARSLIDQRLDVARVEHLVDRCAPTIGASRALGTRVMTQPIWSRDCGASCGLSFRYFQWK